jgi:hypothetical protein
VIVAGQHFSPPLLQRLEQEGASLSRRQLARQLCHWLDWKGPTGRFQEMSARKALATLQHTGHLHLPPPTAPPPSRRVVPARRLAATPDPPALRSLEELGPVELKLVPPGRSTLGRAWRELLEQEHYLGAGPLCGAQLRYLIDSAQGYLGGLAFSAAAWRLAPRDQWIGWHDVARSENLHRVVNNSRFLIRAKVHVPNLASHILSQALQRLPADWQARYGYRPVLVETFVELGRFAGISYGAANWQAIGLTQGRGRQDTTHQARRGRKIIWVKPLQPDFRAVLRTPPSQPRLARAAPALVLPPQGRLPVDWAENEFGAVPLGDGRLRTRLLILARDFYARPTATLPESCAGSWAKYRAACRFFDHRRTAMNVLLSSHYQATMRRVAQEKVVLAVQDTTSLNYTAHAATELLGPISTHADGAQGLLVHDTMAFTIDGTPLGLLDVQCWARDPEEAGKKHQRREVPFEQKESAKWLHSAQAVAGLRPAAPQTLLVSVGDREADVYELFAWAQAEATAPKLLVRATQDRGVAGEQGQLWAQMQAQIPEVGYEVRVPRRGTQPARTARLEVRYGAVELRPPVHRQHLGPVNIWAVLAQEVGAPPGVEPIEWMLLTTVPVLNAADALERLRWYVQRWNIEVYHRTLKSGCRIEDRQLAGAERLESCLAIDLVVAWRVFHLTKLGRQTPDVPCTVYFEDDEWKALSAYATKCSEPPAKPPSLWAAMAMVAMLGGWFGRKSDGPPGTQVLWRGLQRLDDLSAMWRVMTGRSPGESTLPVSSNFDYG